MGREFVRQAQSQQQDAAYTVEELVALNPYNPDILPDLDNHVNEQVQEEEADQEEDEVDDMGNVPDPVGPQGGDNHEPRFGTMTDWRSHNDEQFRLLIARMDEQIPLLNSTQRNICRMRASQEEQSRLLRLLIARFDAHNPYGWQRRFPPPPSPDMY